MDKVSNADMPARPVDGGEHNFGAPMAGLTKKEYACIHCGVPETGDPDLDAIIAKGNKYRSGFRSELPGKPAIEVKQ